MKIVKVIGHDWQGKVKEISLPLLTSLVCVLMVCHHLIQDGDPFWALATGRWILVHHSVPHVDPFSWTARGKPWVAHEWGYDTLMFLLAFGLGYYGLMVLTWVALFGLLAFLWLLCRKEKRSATATLIVFFIAALLPEMFVMARPQVYSYFFFALFLYILTWFSQTRRRWLLPVLVLFWANLHGSVVMGVLMVFFENVMEFWLEKDLSLWPVTITCFLASLANPSGLGLWKYVFWLSTNSWNKIIQEWQPPDFKLPLILVAYLIIYLTVFLALYQYKQNPHYDAFRKRRLVTAFLYFAGFSYLAVTGVRYFPYLVVVWAVLILKLLPGDFMAWAGKKTMKLALLVWVIAAGLFCLLNFPCQSIVANAGGGLCPADAVRYIKVHHLESGLLNYYTWGGYLIYEGIPPFIDGRSDIYLGGTHVFQDYTKTLDLAQDPAEVLDRYGIKTILIPPQLPFRYYLQAEKNCWQEVFRGKNALVFVRKNTKAPES